MRISKTTGLIILTALLSLGGCGGGASDTPAATTPSAAASTTATTAATAQPRSAVVHGGHGAAKLGTLTGAQVEVFDLHRSTPVATATTDGRGHFDVTLPTDVDLDEYVDVRVTGGTDIDFLSKGSKQTPVPNRSTLRAVLTGRELMTHGAIVNVLTDYLARRVSRDLEHSEPTVVRMALDEAAEDLIVRDLNGDGEVDYVDILHFDPSDAGHKAALARDYEDFYIPNSDTGLSVMEMYHEGDPKLDHMLSAVMVDIVDLALPTAEEARLAVLNFGVEGNGSIEVSVLKAPVGGMNGGHYRRALAKGSDPITVTLTPGAGAKLAAWTGCTPSAANPLVCTTTAEAGKAVVAMMEAPALARDDAGITPLPEKAGVLGIVAAADRLVVTARSGTPEVDALDALVRQLGAPASKKQFIAGAIARHQMLRVTASLGRSVVDGVVRFDFAYTPAHPQEAEQTVTSNVQGGQLAVDAIASMSVYGGAAFAPKNGTTTDATPGPNPADVTLTASLCRPTQSLLTRADGGLLCVDEPQATVQHMTAANDACPADRAVVEALDGRRFCARADQLPSAATVSALVARSTPMQRQSVHAQALAQELARPVAYADAPALQRGDSVWVVGQGQGVYIRDDLYLIDRPGGGISLVTPTERPAAVAQASKRALAWQACRGDAAAPECALLDAGAASRKLAQEAGRRIAQGVKVGAGLLPNDISVNYTPPVWLKLDFKANIDATGNVDGRIEVGMLNDEGSRRPGYRAWTTGTLKVTPYASLSVTADGVAMFRESDGKVVMADGKDRDSLLKAGRSVYDKELLQIDFISKMTTPPISSFLTSKLRISVGVDAVGKAKLDFFANYTQLAQWDVRSEYIVRLGSNHSWHYAHFGAKGYPGATFRANVNASLGLYARATLTVGPTMVPRLLNMEAEYYPFKFEGMGKLFASYQTEPEALARQFGQEFCWAGTGSMTVRESAKASVRVEADTAATLLQMFNINPVLLERDLFSMDRVRWTVGEVLAGDSATGNAAAGAATAMEANEVDDPESGSGGSGPVTRDSTLKCAPPNHAKAPALRSWNPGDFRLDAGQSVINATGRLSMSPEGRLVVEKRTGDGYQVVWTSPVRQTGVAYHAVFQRDGNLVIYDLMGRPQWASGTSDKGASALRFEANGVLGVVSDAGGLWNNL